MAMSAVVYCFRHMVNLQFFIWCTGCAVFWTRQGSAKLIEDIDKYKTDRGKLEMFANRAVYKMI